MTSAAFVAGPKKFVSFPLEPTPATATVKPLVLRKTWRARTSSPVIPAERERVNEVLVVEGVVVDEHFAPVVELKLSPDLQSVVSVEGVGVGIVGVVNTGRYEDPPPPPPITRRVGVATTASVKSIAPVVLV